MKYSESIKPISYLKTQESIALLKILALSGKEIKLGKLVL